MTSQYLRLGVNIDHVATIRNARGGVHPDPLRAAKIAEKAGADGITAHLREDRRHISDRDIDLLRNRIDLPLNLEMAATDEMLGIALKHLPPAVCLVPENREERTTEGGLDVDRNFERLTPFAEELGAAGIRLSLFVEPDQVQLEAAKALGAPVVELHTGTYCNTQLGSLERDKTLAKIVEASAHAERLGLECHAGHGLGFETVGPIAAIPSIVELNIGHFLIGEAIFGGLEITISQMRALLDNSRADMIDSCSP